MTLNELTKLQTFISRCRVVRWSVEQLSEDQRQEIASWPATIRISIPDLGDVLFCHATARNENDIFTRLTPEDVVGIPFASPVLAGYY